MRGTWHVGTVLRAGRARSGWGFLVVVAVVVVGGQEGAGIEVEIERVQVLVVKVGVGVVASASYRLQAAGHLQGLAGWPWRTAELSG